MTKVSVLMSCFNSDKYISNAIESILNQTHKDIEFIIIDDGSTDSTSDIIKSYQSKSNLIKLYSNNNQGLTKSLNYGLQYCSGEWIARMDADDISNPNRIEKQLNLGLSDKNIALIGSSFEIINYKKIFLPSDKQELRQRILIGKSIFPHSSFFINKNILLREGGYNNFYYNSQDLDLFLRIYNNYNIKCIEESLLKIRTYDNAYNKNYRKKQLTYRYCALSEHFNKINQMNKKNLFNDTETLLEKLSIYKFDEFSYYLKNIFNMKIIFIRELLFLLFKNPNLLISYFSRKKIIYKLITHIQGY